MSTSLPLRTDREGCEQLRRLSKPNAETSVLNWPAFSGEGLRWGMQLKRFQLFRDDVRDLVNLTVDRSSYALPSYACVVSFSKLCIQEWTSTTSLEPSS